METDCEHPVGRMVQEQANALGKNFKAIPPSVPDGQWIFKVWDKGRSEPTDDDE